jgi:hypothetical protein
MGSSQFETPSLDHPASGLYDFKSRDIYPSDVRARDEEHKKLGPQERLACPAAWAKENGELNGLGKGGGSGAVNPPLLTRLPPGAGLWDGMSF